MGFICVVRNEETDVTKLKKGVWPDAYIYSEDTKEPERLTNGAQVIMIPNSIAVQTKDGKFADIITTPGGYLYHENAPVNERLEDYATFMQGMVELFMQEAEMEATGLAFIETDRQISSPEELRAWFMQFAQPEEPTPEPELTPEQAPELIPEPVVAPAPTVAEQPVMKQVSVASAPQSGQNEIWECPACGTRNQFSFCKNCGKAKPEVPLKKQKGVVNSCPGCGKDLRNYTKIKFCPSCGKAL